MNWFSDGISRSGGFDVKSGTTAGTTYPSEEGSPMDSFRTHRWHKSPISEADTAISRPPPSDASIPRISTEVKELPESPAISHPSPAKTSPSLHSVSSLSTSPLSSQYHFHPPSSTPSRWPRRSPGHQLLRQISDSRIPAMKSSPSFSMSEEWSNGGGSDTWSNLPFDLTTTPRRERWSFDSESLMSFTRDKIVSRSNGRISSYQSSDNIQTCGVCLKLLTEKSSWGSQKIIGTNELAVVAILICGHAYHAECLENMTPEISKYDPGCPVCTFGEKQTVKMSEKALRAEMEAKARNKRSKKRVVDGDVSSHGGDSVVFDRQKSSGGFEGKLKLSSSLKSSLGKPFLKRHFSFGSSKGSRSTSEKKKGFFWAKSTKE
jgi:hypothetical protein